MQSTSNFSNDLRSQLESPRVVVQKGAKADVSSSQVPVIKRVKTKVSTEAEVALLAEKEQKAQAQAHEWATSSDVGDAIRENMLEKHVLENVPRNRRDLPEVVAGIRALNE